MSRISTVNFVDAAKDDVVHLREEPAGSEIAHAETPQPTRAQYDEVLAEVQRLNSAVANLTVALDTNRDIAAAVGILMAMHKLRYEEAFDLLRSLSQRHHIKLRALAQEVIETGSADTLSALSAGPRPASRRSRQSA